MDALRNSKKN